MLITTLALLSGAHAADRFVPSQYATLDDAIAASTNGDRIFVAAGRHQVNEPNLPSKSIEIYGDGSGSTVLHTGAGGNVMYIEAATVLLSGLTLDAQGSRAVLALYSGAVVTLDDVVLQGGAGTYVSGDPEVTFSGGQSLWISGGSRVEAHQVVMQDVTNGPSAYGRHLALSGGATFTGSDITIDGGSAYAGGGFYLTGGSVMRCDHCTVQNNVASFVGGGGYVIGGSSLTLADSRVLSNTAQGGGGVYESGSRASLTANLWCDNLSTDGSAYRGGAVYFNASGFEMTGNLFRTSITRNDGGAVGMDSSTGTILNNTFVDNLAGDQGGALSFQGANVVTFTNNLVAFNEARVNAFRESTGDVVTRSYSWFYDNTVGDGITPNNTETVGQDPLLAGLVPGACTVADVVPQDDSPLIDAGDPLRTDADGSPSDIGAFGGPTPSGFVDRDGDGYLAVDECDDTRSAVNPGAAEVCDDRGLDEDCDGLVNIDDPDLVGETLWPDADGDGYGDRNAAPVNDCPRDGLVDNGDDCDDNDASVTTAGRWYADSDGDGFGDAATFVDGCAPGAGWVDNGDDCDDTDPAENPGAVWFSDGDGDGYGADASAHRCERLALSDVTLGGDCDDADAAENPGVTWYADVDGDGFGDDASSQICERGAAGDVTVGGDCNDADAGQNPDVTWYADLDGDGAAGDTVSSQCAPADASDQSAVTDCDDADADEYPGQQWHADADGDGFGAAAVSNTCERDQPTDVLDATDCDDGDADENPSVTWYADADGDGFGDPDQASACTRASSDDVRDATDCDDADATENPEVRWYSDSDGDGVGAVGPGRVCERAAVTDVEATGDCDDTDAAVLPGATEVCDGIDNDCDGAIDDADADVDPSTQLAWYTDDDADGFGSGAVVAMACAGPEGSAAVDGDCDDSQPTDYPGAPEQCDGRDNDCNGVVDNDVTVQDWYADGDGDGWGSGTPVSDCAQPAGSTPRAGDCDDGDAAISPDADEICDGVDNDCNQLVDDDPIDGVPYYGDVDGDGFGNIADELLACSQPGGYVADLTDCDDTTAAVNPAEDETCDGLDNDCDGQVDVGATDEQTWYLDTDGDGVGAGAGVTTCTPPMDHVLDGGDCDDNEPEVYPSNPEICDGLDNDCNGVVDDGVTGAVWYVDGDGDGYGDDSTASDSCPAAEGSVDRGGDCDDTLAEVNPAAEEVAGNGIDENCDGSDGVDLDTSETPDRSFEPDESQLASVGASGCDCSSSGSPAGLWLPLAGLLAVGLRRRP